MKIIVKLLHFMFIYLLNWKVHLKDKQFVIECGEGN